MCMKHGGLSEQEALALVTINPARQLGIDGYVGSIAQGKDADLALFNGHPLSPYSRCVLTLIDGEVVFEKRDVPNRSTPGYHPMKRLRRDAEPPQKSDRFAIVGATVHPVSRPPYEGIVVVENGKIVKAEPLRPGDRPKEMPFVNAVGLHVYPGMIDAHTSIGLAEIGSIAGTKDFAEIGNYQPDLRAIAAVNPHSEMIPVTRANGITTALA